MNTYGSSPIAIDKVGVIQEQVKVVKDIMAESGIEMVEKGSRH